MSEHPIDLNKIEHLNNQTYKGKEKLFNKKKRNVQIDPSIGRFNSVYAGYEYN